MRRLLFLALLPAFLFCTENMYCYSGKKIRFSQEVWKEKLSDEEFDVMRMGNKEPPFEGRYRDSFDPGIYECAACSLPLFSSVDKIEPVHGYATFIQPICRKNIVPSVRVHRWSNTKKLQCARCQSYIGRVYDDPKLEYRLYSVALDFQPSVSGARRGGRH